MIKNNSKNREFLSTIIGVILLLSTIILFQSLISLEENSEQIINKSKKVAYEEKQKELKNYVTLAYKTLNSYYSRTKKDKIKNEVEDYIKENSDFLFSIINSEYEKNKEKLPKEELKKRIKSIIESTRYGKSGYFWINDFDYKMIMHPIKNDLEGKYFKNNPTVPFVQLGVDKLKSSNKNTEFINYKFYNPSSKQTIFKSSIVKVFKPYNWIIGTGAYIDDVSQKMKKEALEALSKMRYAETGYFWVINSNHKLLMDGTSSTFPNKDMYNVKNKKNSYIYRKIVSTANKNKEGGFVKYFWTMPKREGEFEKLSYIQNFTPWDFIIGTGAYVEDIEKNSIKIDEEADKNLSFVIRIVILFTLMIFLMIILLINTQKKRKAEEKSQEQLDFQQTLVDNVDIPIFYKNKNLKFSGCNKAFENFFRKKREDILGKTAQEIFPKNIAQEYDKKDNKLLETKKQQNYEGVISTTADSTKNIIYNKNLFYDKNGDILGIVGSMFDITKLKDKTKELNYLNKNLEEKINIRTEEINKQKEILQKTIDAQNSILVVTDFKTISFFNNSFAKFFNVNTKEEFIERYNSVLDIFCEYKDYLHKGELKELIRPAKQFFELINSLSQEKRMVVILDSKFEAKSFFINMTIVDEEKDFYLISLTDITKITTEKVIAEQKAYIDGLTGVANRNKFEDIFEKELNRTKRYNKTFSIAILDIDHFKKFNDNFGHLIGDEVLVATAQECQNKIRNTDLFARWGGEEFIFLFPETKLDKAILIIEKIRKDIQKLEHKIAGNITCSFGVTQYKEEDDISTIFKRCDEALYNAKEKGRNRVESL